MNSGYYEVAYMVNDIIVKKKFKFFVSAKAFSIKVGKHSPVITYHSKDGIVKFADWRLP